ncbi:MAG: hypothetical protein H6831_14240 [Planctomycetes bacterium]|nr:hypothetical protein [Planctomycetota bacterium]MCB9905561.1 hypothetical protein [Planctomycetota bacterium]
MKRRLHIVGSGKRVLETALPVLKSATDWELAGISSRRARRITNGTEEFDVTALDILDADTLANVDLVYLVVAKPAVPDVLQRLAPHVPAKCELLIETPVMLFKHLGYLDRLEAFRRVWVSEDCFTLPCWDPLRATGERFTSAHFDHSAYSYHGVAMARAVLGNARVRAARSDAVGRRVSFDGGASFTTREPRDYRVGRFSAEGSGLPVADHDPGREHRRLAALGTTDELVGFRLDDAEHELSTTERAVVGAPGEGDGMFRWMDGMKRVGFLRLLDALAHGRPAYALDDALEDAVVDYWLHRVGRYRATALTDPRRGAARLCYRLLTKAAGLRRS